MTPDELLDLAKQRFVPLYYNDPIRLEALLRTALGAYQDRAGCVLSVRTASDTAAKPSDLLEVYAVQDAFGRYHEATVSENAITVQTDTESAPPFTIWYLADLRGWPVDKDLPGGITGAVLDYLIALIDIYNTERARAAALATGRQMDLPSNEELLSRKIALEADMADAQGFLPMVCVY